MKSVFIDTSFLIASVASDDQNHAASLAWEKRLRGVPLIITEFVLLEVMDGFCIPGQRALGVGIWESLR